MATIRKGDTVRYRGRGNAWLEIGGEYVVQQASSSHVKVYHNWNGQQITSWLLIENFELVRSVYVEYEALLLVYRLGAGIAQTHVITLGPGGIYRTKEHCDRAYRDAGYTVIGWKRVTLPFRV